MNERPTNFRAGEESHWQANVAVVREELLEPLVSLPDLLKDRWAVDIARLPEEEWGERLNQLLVSREQTEHTGGVYVRGEAKGKVTTSETLRGKVITEYVESLMKNQENLIDCGQAACVFVRARKTATTTPKRRVCYKVAKKGEPPKGTRTLAEEVDYQEEAARLCVREGVRVPRVYTYVDGHHGVIAMEYFPGIQLEKLLQNPKLIPSVLLNSRNPLGPLEELVKVMNERYLFHGDIHGGNVLVNLATGELALIDFGQACHAAELHERQDSLLERTIRTRSGQTIEHVVQSDSERVIALKKRLSIAIGARKKTGGVHERQIAREA